MHALYHICRIKAPERRTGATLKGTGAVTEAVLSLAIAMQDHTVRASSQC